MKKAEVVLIPLPAMGHIVAMVETAKLLVQRDNRFSATVLLMKPPTDPCTATYMESLSASILPTRMRVIELPALRTDLQESSNWFVYLIESNRSHVREVVSKLMAKSELSPDSPRLASFVFDTFCTGMRDVADEFGIPWYVFSASGAAFLGSMLHFQELHDEQHVDLTELKNSNAELRIPSFVNPFPAKLASDLMVEKEAIPFFLAVVKRLRECRGIIANTFAELESPAISALSNDGKTPPLYPVGPIIKSNGDHHDVGSEQRTRDIVEWLDDQPPSSVVFLCFGSFGSFGADQVQEIAHALEHSGHRFLWTLRKPSSLLTGNIEPPIDYEDFKEILSDEFFDRTAKIGKVIGWAPQVKILSHPSIGGFVSHCGWNSALESICFGIPIATWPMYAEQQLNAFQIVKELGIGVEIKMDYKKDLITNKQEIVNADVIEKGIRHVMRKDSEIRRKVKEMSEISKKCLMDGGSSYSSFGSLLEDMMNKKPLNETTKMI